MANAVAKAKINLPADINKEMADEVARLQSRLSAPSGDRIQVTQGKTFKLPNGQEIDGPLPAVIIDFVAANYFYEQAYSRDQVSPPTCFALGMEPAGLTPSPNSPDVQSPACTSCWANQFGSSGKGKACQNTRLLAVIPTDADADTPIWVLRVSPTAIRAFDGYVSTIARKYGAAVRAVVTNIDFSGDADYATLRFNDAGPVSKDLLMLAQSRKEEALNRLLTEPEITQAAEAPAKSKKAPAKLVSKPAPRAAARR